MAPIADPRSWLDKLVGICLGILLAATALYIAVQLIEAVAADLVVILGIGVLLTIAVAVVRSRNRGW